MGGEECYNGVCRLTETGLRCVCHVGYYYNPTLKGCFGKITKSAILYRPVYPGRFFLHAICTAMFSF